MAKLKGLGRGLDALLGGEDSAAPPQGDLRMMSVTQLAPGKYQPRSRPCFNWTLATGRGYAGL